MVRRSSILFLLGAAGVIAGLPDRAKAQLFRARAQSVNRLGSAITSPLLDRMFGTGRFSTPCLSARACIPYRGSSIGTAFLTDGTPYDPWLAGSFPDRYQNNGALYGTTALSSTARGLAYVSSNAVDVGAPARYRLTPPALDSGINELTPRPIGGGWTTDLVGPAESPFLPPVSSAPPMAAGDLSQALWAAKRSISITPATSQFHPPSGGAASLAKRIGEKSFRRGEYALARDDFRRAIARDAKDPTLWLALGLAEFARGRWSPASKAIAEGFKRSPELDPETFDLRAAYGRDGDFDKHMARLDAAAKTNAGADLWLLLGYIRFFSGDPSGGSAAWEKYAAMPGADPRIISLLDRIKSAQGS